MTTPPQKQIEEGIEDFDALTAQLNEGFPDTYDNYISVGNTKKMSDWLRKALQEMREAGATNMLKRVMEAIHEKYGEVDGITALIKELE